MATKRPNRPNRSSVDTSHAKFGKRAPVKIKRPIGRPTMYRKEYCALLIDHMREGWAFETFGATVGVSHEAPDKWVAAEVVEVLADGTTLRRPKHPEFVAAKMLGRKLCLQYWEQLGRDLIKGRYPGGKAAVWIFSMKNRFRWTDRVENIVEDLRQPIVEGEHVKSERLRLLMQNPEARKLLEALQRIEEKMLPNPKDKE